MGVRAAAWGVGAAGVIAIAVLVLPVLGEGSMSPLLFVLVAFRALTLLAGLIGVTVIAIVLLIIKRRKASALVAALAVVLIVPFVLSVNGGTTTEVPRAGPSDELRILSWNTGQRDVDDVLMALIQRTRPDIIALPEYFTTLAQGRFVTFAEENDFSVYGWDGSSATVLISNRLGAYTLRNDETPAWAGISLVSDNPSSPSLIIAHLQRPMLTEGTDLWRQHIDWVKDLCSTPNVIAVGDFNATTANLGTNRLASCINASSTLNQRDAGTWPTWMPAALGAQIDHVFAGSGWQPTWFGVLKPPRTDWSEESDHRPIYAILSRK